MAASATTPVGFAGVLSRIARVAGVIAAAGIVALEQMVERLAEDHDNARLLAAGMAGLSGISVEAMAVRTNIVYFNVTDPAMDAAQLVACLSGQGVRMLQLGPRRIRAVTHHHVTAADIQSALAALRQALG